MYNIETMDYLIKQISHYISQLFTTKYASPQNIYVEDYKILTNQYCFYFAKLLQEYFPEGKVVYVAQASHYIFLYDENYSQTELYSSSPSSSVVVLPKVPQSAKSLALSLANSSSSKYATAPLSPLTPSKFSPSSATA